LDIYRVEVLTKRWWQREPRWTPLRYWRWGDELVPWEGRYDEACRREGQFILDEWEAIYREEDNWITVDDREQG
jgi:hypothetical protein